MKRDIKNGYGTISKSVMQNNELSIGSKGVYSYLATFAGDKDIAYPSMAKMSFDLNVNTKTLRLYINELVNAKIIDKNQQIYNNSKKYANNIYEILQ